MRRIVKMLYIRVKWRKKNVKIGNGCDIAVGASFEGHNIIHDNTSFVGSLGYGSYVDSWCDIRADIGRYCCIAKHVLTACGNHPTRKYVSIHPAFYSTSKQAGFSYTNENLYKETNYYDDARKVSVLIGNDVWIGANVTLIGKIKIGDGAIVAAGSVVTGDVEPYSIVAGNPAKVIRKRFTDKQIELLLRDKWWNKDEKELSKLPYLFSDIEKYEGYVGKNDEY